MYREIILFLWLLTRVLMTLLMLHTVSAQSVGLGWQNSRANLAGALLLVAALHALMDIFGGVLGYVEHKHGWCESEVALA